MIDRGDMTPSSDRIYEKLIEMSVRQARMESKYDEGRSHALDAADRNAREHKEICEKLDRKANLDDVRGWIWIQQNPRVIFVLFLIIAGGTAASGTLLKLITWLEKVL